MTDKEIAKQVIDTLPKGATLDDIMHALSVRAKFAKGEQKIRDGKGISHQVAKRRLRKWIKI